MGVDRGLGHELLRNPQAETDLFNQLETERSGQRVIFEKYQHQLMELGPRLAQPAYYHNRDDAFFKNLNLIRQLKSKVNFVTDFQQPPYMPKIKRGDAHIISALEKHDPNNTTYLAIIEEFIADKKAHESTIERLNKWVIDVHDEIKALLLPQVLYFLLIYLPPIFALYRWFRPVNSLDTALRLGEKLSNHLFELETEIEQEDERFYKKWGNRYSEYLFVLNSQKLIDLRASETEYNEALEHKNILTTFIRQTDQPELQRAYQDLINQPSYIHLFQLCSKLCLHKFELGLKNENEALVDQSLNALRKLYPEVQKELHLLELTTLANLSESTMFDMLKNKYEEPIQEIKSLRQKINLARTKMAELTKQSSNLKLDTNQKLIVENKGKIQKYYEYLDKAEQRLQKLISYEKYLQPLKTFLENRTGENLQKLYQFSLDPNNHLPVSDLLKKLYPSALRELREENINIALSDSRTLYTLLDKYLASIIRIENSNEVKLQPYREVAHVLHELLSTSDWTWEHISRLEKAIRNNPDYFRHPVLAEVFTEVTRMVAKSKLFPELVEKKPLTVAPATPELIINQPNPLPTFFQAPLRVSANANALIKEILGNINAYKIRFNDGETPSDEEKQENIQIISNEMLNYINLLSGEDSVQTISPEHLALLQELTTFISSISHRTHVNVLKESDFQHINELMAQLASEHPVRKGIEFLTNLYRSKTDYMAITTEFAQKQLHKDINKELLELNKIIERHRTRKTFHGLTLEATLNMDRWNAASSLLKMLNRYTHQLEQYASSNNNEEYTKVKQLSANMDKIYKILRYERDKYSIIPSLIDQCEHNIETLGDHPVCLAAEKAIEALQETTEYAQISAVKARPKR